MAAGGHFGCPKLTLNGISGHFRSIRNFYIFFYFLTKWPPALILDVRNSLSIAFLAISDRCKTLFFWEILTKWLPSAILDVRNSLPIVFLAILDQCGIFIFLNFFDKMSAVGRFGCPKFTFDRISGHFRSIRKFNFLEILTKWPFWIS